LAVGAVARGAALRVDRLAAARVELVDGDQLVGRDRILPAPCRIHADRVASRQPREVRRDREHFFRSGRGQDIRSGWSRLRLFTRYASEMLCAVLAAQKAVDDAVGEADEARGPVVVFG